MTQVLYGGGPALTNSGGVPWTAAYIDTIGDPTADLRSNIAAEARAKIVYERLIALTDDPGVKDALGFLMTREIAHQQSFEKALYSIQPNFPPGKLRRQGRVHQRLLQHVGGRRRRARPVEQRADVRVPRREPAVDGGSGLPELDMTSDEVELAERAAIRLASDPSADPVTGAMLGMGETPAGVLGGASDTPAGERTLETHLPKRPPRKNVSR